MDQLSPTQQKKAYGLMVAFFLLFFFQPNMAILNPALGILAEHYQVDAGMASYITSIPAIAQLFLAVVSGFIVGKKISFKAFLVLCVAGITIFGALPGVIDIGFTGCLVCRALYGFFLGGFQPVINAAVIMHYQDKNERAKIMGFSNTGFNVGIFFFLFAGGIIAGMGWQAPFLAYLMGILWILIVLFLFKEPPADILTKSAAGEKKPKVKIPFVGWAFMIGFCILNMAYQPVVMLTANIFMFHNFGDPAIIGTVMSAGFIVGAIVVAFFGVMFKVVGRWLLAITLLIETVGFLLIAFGGVSESFIIFLVGFIVASVMNSIMSAGVPHFIGLSVSPAAYTVAMGFFAAIFNIGSFLGSPFIQFSMTLFDGSQDYANVFWIAAVVGALLFVFHLFLAVKYKFISSSEAAEKEAA